MKLTAKRIAVPAAAAGVAAAAIGASVLASAPDPVAPEVVSATPAEPGHADEGEYTAGDFVLHVRELDDSGVARDTAIGPRTTYSSKTLHGTGTWRPTVVEFSAGPDPDGTVVFRYPVPGPGRSVACAASGTEASPHVRCETRVAR